MVFSFIHSLDIQYRGGGTDTNKVLNEISQKLSQSLDENVSNHIILLTDGDLGSSHSIIEKINKVKTTLLSKMLKIYN